MQIKTTLNNLENYKKYLTVLKTTKDYLDTAGYLEIDLPVLSPSLVPESYLEVFESEYRFLETKQKLYLTPSPELFLKRILAYGTLDCYYLGKAFRNSEPASERHSSEFTMLEFYKLNATYMDIADELLILMQSISQKLFKSMTFTYQEHTVDVSKWEKLTVVEAFEKYADISSEELFSHEKLIEKAQKKGYTIDGATYEDMFSQIYTHEVEPHLGVNGFPTLLYDYPAEFAALAQLNPDRKTAQRFEFYIGGVELGDCYSELTNPEEQNSRFTNEDTRRKENNLINHPVDDGFIKALEHGLPQCAGIAVGFERLAMVFANLTSIHDLKLIEVA